MPYIQPDSSSCVPTTFAYLAHKQCKLSFASLQAQLMTVCSARFDLIGNGMSFGELAPIVTELGFGVEVTSVKPQQAAYLVGVKSLPLTRYQPNPVIDQAILDGSLEIAQEEFIYPEGHAVAVFEIAGTFQLYDSFLGTERKITIEEVLISVETKPEFLAITACPSSGI